MTIKKWIELKTEPGKPECKARLEIIPRGPFLLIPQHLADKFERDYISFNIQHSSSEFMLWLGYVTYAITDNGPVKCGYYYDTSD